MDELEIFNSIKTLIVNKGVEAKPEQLEKEMKFLSDATKACLGTQDNSSAFKEYDPKLMMDFLSLPTEEIMKKMGEPWCKMEKMSFEVLTFTMKQKIQKSTSIINWEE